MGITGFVPALVAGLVVGAVGGFLLPDGPSRPGWLAILVGVVGALVGTAVARLVGVADGSGVTWVGVAYPLAFAAAGVAALATVTGRRRTSGAGRRTT